ncbi:class I SAM-dependent methyltransferase [Cyanobium sp. Cruz-8H5]|uniref:class I SAM-dependent methyltransferase n=1 Tax=Cyanobium sp. Cruz-8H5 TaxID=2823712 RepID=UPI0020CCBE48|nr:class I SAM-dependent methyltransferase [Cyanobium sp. Cruz-8H5]
MPIAQSHTLVSPDFDPTGATTSNLDVYHQRRSLLLALRDALPSLKGHVLDVGAGDQPYKAMIEQAIGPSGTYTALDMPGSGYSKPDLLWDGDTIPLQDCTVDSALATEVFEHCPSPVRTMSEIRRVLKPNGVLFFTVPFLWPLHCAPYDEYRYTPFAIKRLLECAGFEVDSVKALGGWDASLAQMLALWIRRRPMGQGKRRVLTPFVKLIVNQLLKMDKIPHGFESNQMPTGLSGIARRPRF